jgi:malic enzyme
MSALSKGAGNKGILLLFLFKSQYVHPCHAMLFCHSFGLRLTQRQMSKREQQKRWKKETKQNQCKKQGKDKG